MNFINSLQLSFLMLNSAFLIFNSASAQVQKQTAKSFTINANESSQSHHYIGRDHVTLNSGFVFDPYLNYDPVTKTGNKYFIAEVDNTLVFPADYLTEAPLSFGRNLDKSLPVGSIVGSAGVTQTGAGTYQIPIFTPPGTAGMQPGIALVYNSQGGNGIAGCGWEIAGLSVITRVPQTIFNEGQVRGVDLTTNDRFALDGNRLIVTSGTYGATGSFYHTELETFNQVEAKSVTSDGPGWFEVKTKDGLIMQYGNSSDSKFMGEGTNSSKVIFWRINRISDLNGNYIDFIYQNDTRESRIDEIKYAGAVNNTIKFYYALRNDKNEYWVAGSSIKKELLLRMIRVYSEGKFVKGYELKHFTKQYTSSTERPFSQLGEITEYNGDGMEHFNSTAFRYGENLTDFIYAESEPLVEQNTLFLSGDYNGDGLYDLLIPTVVNNSNNRLHHSSYKLYLNDNGDLNSIPITSSLSNFSEILDPMSDFNGDGNSDIAIARFTGADEDGVVPLNNIKLYEYSNGISLYKTFDFSSETYNQTDISSQYFYPGDFDGDGAIDFLTILSNGQGSFQMSLYFPVIGIAKTIITNIDADVLASADKLFVIDFNGDGKQDLMAVKEYATNIYTFTNNGVASSLYSKNYPTKFHHIYIGDFNGDKKTDLLTYLPVWNISTVAYSTGFEFKETPFTFTTSIDFTNHKLKIGDYNGDGKSDVLHAFNSGANNSKINIYYSNGKAFQRVENNFTKSLGVPPFVSGDFNGDGKTDEIHLPQYTNQKFDILSFYPFNHLTADGKEQLLLAVVNGLNLITEFNYQPLSVGTSKAGSIYRQTSSDYFQGPLYVVRNLSSINSIGGNSYVDFTYSDAVVHRTGRGFLGFKKILKENNSTNTTTLEKYQLNTTFSFLALLELYIATGAEDISNTLYTPAYHQYGSSKRFFPYTQKAVTTKHFPPTYDYTKFEVVEKTMTYDVQGNGNLMTESTIYKKSNGDTEATIKNEFQYTTFGTWWIPSRLSKSTVTMTRPNEVDYVREVAYTSYNAAGQLLQQITDPTKTKKVTTDFVYDNPFGNLSSTTVTADGVSRTESVLFDPYGRFVISTTNVLGQTSSAEYDPIYGNITKKTDVDGLVTSYKYDAFGRLTQATTPDGNTSTVSMGWITDFTPFTLSQNPIYYIQNQVDGAPDVKTTYNILGQEVRTETDGFNGKVYVDKEYDYLGKISKVSQPYSGTIPVFPKLWTEYKYNSDYGYLNQEIFTDNTNNTYTTTYSINLKTTTVNNPAGQSRSNTTNSLGEIITATDNGGTINYTYYSSGLPKTTVTNGMTVSMEYDEYGRQKKLTDPNAGITSYEYDALGQLIWQKDARNNEYKLHYDLLGRVYLKENATEGNTEWQYVNSGNGLNNVKKITGTSTVAEFTYDNLGKTTAYKETIDGTNYETKYEYDTYSNLIKTTYPSGFEVKNTYDTKGFLASVYNDNHTFWAPNKVNALGQIEKYYFRNNTTVANFAYDANNLPDKWETGNTKYDFNFNGNTGNLTSRMRTGIPTLIETFGYDALNRLNTAQVTGQSAFTVNYHANGNIKNKSDVSTKDYIYNTTQIHAIKRVEDATSAISTIPQTITYTPFNKAETITEGDYKLTYTYGSDQQRRISELKKISTGTTEKKIIYYGNYEVIKTGSDEYKLCYIPSPQGLQIVAVKKNAETEKIYYIYTDYLGSMTEVYDETGALIYVQNYGAWGRERNPVAWDYSANTFTKPEWLIRGYTGHEHLSEFGLINMNGRMYDPLLGRMLSPDNFIQNATNTQGYNRYTYALNNPLVYTDPSGMAAGPYSGPVFSYHSNFYETGGPAVYVDDMRVYGGEAQLYLNLINNGGRGGGSGISFASGWGFGGGGTTSFGPEATNTYYQLVDGNGVSISGLHAGTQGKQWIMVPEYGTAWAGYPGYEGFKGYYIKGYKMELVEGAANGGVDGITRAAINHGMPNMTATFDRQLAETYYWFKYLAIGKTTAQKMDIMLTYMSKGAPYDFKNRKSSPFHKENMGEFGLYRGQKMAPDDFGNYNYGFAANALGLSEWFSVGIVGAFSNSERTWWNVSGFFDEIKDSRMIRAGYNHEW